jgi:hypothetical protein
MLESRSSSAGGLSSILLRSYHTFDEARIYTHAYAYQNLTLNLFCVPVHTQAICNNDINSIIKYVQRKNDCNLHTGIFPPLTVAAAAGTRKSYTRLFEITLVFVSCIHALDRAQTSFVPGGSFCMFATLRSSAQYIGTHAF